MSASSHDRRRGRVAFPAPRGAAATLFTTFALAGCVGGAFAADVALTPTALDASKAPSSAHKTIPARPTLANPTGHDLRGEDAYGAGFFGASRAAGARRHRGADYVAEPGEIVRAPISGVVERIGFAYRGDERYRYVELADAVTGRDVRVLYVGPIVQLGAVVEAGAPIGRAQDLSARYPRGITNHVHVELRQSGALTDPADLLPVAAREHAEIEA
ncbi:MAG: M23 family metallopeptidase [Hyphomonadaceae bacterium]|nr:M23 family metallopeptidase [Hyphomonadaceae bacterium]